MDLRRLSPRYFVAPQIAAGDLPAIAAAGITLVICNRPDAEVPPAHRAAAIGAAGRAAGLGFEVLELTHQTMTVKNIARQRAFIEEATGPALAYYASGIRSSVIWALGQAGRMAAGDILARTAAAGYHLGGLRPALEDLARDPA